MSHCLMQGLFEVQHDGSDYSYGDRKAKVAEDGKQSCEIGYDASYNGSDAVVVIIIGIEPVGQPE